MHWQVHLGSLQFQAGGLWQFRGYGAPLLRLERLRTGYLRCSRHGFGDRKSAFLPVPEQIPTD